VSTATLVERLRERGFTFAVEGRAVRVRPASALTQGDRAAIRAELPALLAFLAAPGRAVAGNLPDSATEHAAELACGELWDPCEAARLMADADAVVERLGVDGRHPEITQAAARVVAAHATRDLETVRFACSEFVAVVRTLAARARTKKPATDIDSGSAACDN
jgi:hypothetical protein